MSVISRVLERRDQSYADAVTAALVNQRFTQGNQWTRQVPPIDEDQALKNSTVWSCVTLIADLIATMPYYGYRRPGADGRPQMITPTPTILQSPSAIQSPIEWRTSALIALLLHGNAFGQVTESARGLPTKIELIDPKRVTYRQAANNVASRWTLDHKPVAKWPIGPLWHLPGYTLPGSPFGISVLTYAASAIGLGLSAEGFGRDWFTDSAVPSALLTTTTTLTSGQATEAKDRWISRVRGSREPVVLGGGTWDYKPIELAKDDGQFLQTIEANRATIASFFRVPVELVNGGAPGSSITYTNLESRNQNLLQITLAPWLKRLEQAYTDCLPQPQFVRGDEHDFLRLDAKTMSDIADTKIFNGSWSQDEARDIVDQMPPIPNGAGVLHNWPPHNARLPNASDTSAVDGTEATAPPPPPAPGGTNG